MYYIKHTGGARVDAKF